MLAGFILYLPVWVRVCLFKSKVSLKPLPQKVQRYLLVSLWHFICLFNSLCKLKILEHKRHWNLDGSLSGRAGGSFSTGVFSCGSEERGFLIPWPPLMSSIGASGGIPNWKEIKHMVWKNPSNTSWLSCDWLSNKICCSAAPQNWCSILLKPILIARQQ